MFWMTAYPGNNSLGRITLTRRSAPPIQLPLKPMDPVNAAHGSRFVVCWRMMEGEGRGGVAPKEAAEGRTAPR